MALINCPNCNKNISDKAIKCPQCGKRMKRNKYIFPIIIFISLIIIGVCAGYVWNQYQKVQDEKKQE